MFEEAITYTALQFFTQAQQAAVKIAIESDGKAANVDWERADLVTPYEALPQEGEWLMATGPERALIERLRRDCLRLDDPSLTVGITVGIQTSADKIYHLERLGTDRYRCTPKDGDPYEVRIEDALMKPLVSGAEAKRYEEPETGTYLLFPYERDARGAMGLIPSDEMERRFPLAWAYLRSYETPLRGREDSAFDDEQWYRFGRNQNIDKQDQSKLVVASTVPSMRVTADSIGNKYLNNVRVNGIHANPGVDQFYLLGGLNSPVVDFVFCRIAKPKDGGWFEANKQFIAPLPIPNATPEQRADVAARAHSLQQRWTSRRDLLHAAEERLAVLGRAKHGAKWLWPELPSLPEMIEKAPASLRVKSDRRAWADRQIDELEAQACERLQAAIDRGDLDVRYADGELSLYAAGAPALSRIYLDADAGRITEAYWRWLILSKPPRDAKGFASDLRRPPSDFASPAAVQFVERVATLAAEIEAIEAEEQAMNETLYTLYGLTTQERLLVESDIAARR